MTAASNNTMQLEGKTILLGITGGIAAYKSCNIVRLLQKRGAHVKVVMSEHATEFVGPLTFRALTNEPVAVGLFDDPSDPIHHISLAQEPDLVAVAPATANIIAKMANGIADDLISTTLLATPRPIVVAPAMNNGMWKAPATQANMATLRERGVHVVGPGSGYLACGDVDTGRMSEPEGIVEAVCEVLNPVPQDLAGKRVVITAGPTHEPIDPVRCGHACAGADIARRGPRRGVCARADRSRYAAGGSERLSDGRCGHLRGRRRRLHACRPCGPQTQKGQRAPGPHRTGRDDRYFGRAFTPKGRAVRDRLCGRDR